MPVADSGARSKHDEHVESCDGEEGDEDGYEALVFEYPARIVERAFGIAPCALTEAMTLLQNRLANADS